MMALWKNLRKTNPDISPAAKGGDAQGTQTAQEAQTADRKSKLIPILSLLFVAAVITTAILVSSVNRRHVQLDNGSVWITNQSAKKAARFLPSISEADGAVAAANDDFNVAQSGSQTVLNDVNQAYAVKSDSFSMKEKSATPLGTTVQVGGNTAMLFTAKTGELRLAQADKLSEVSPSSKPALTLPRGSQATVSADGTVYAYRSSDGVVLKFASATSKPEKMDSITGGTARTASQMTVIDGTPVVLSGSSIYWNGKSASFGGQTGLQLEATPESDDTTGQVAISSNSGLNVVDLGSGSVVLTAGRMARGHAARPVTLAGCHYGAWSAETDNYTTVCAANMPAHGAKYETLKEITTSSDLIFRVNHRSVILNDQSNGNAWNPKKSTDVIKIQWDKLQTKDQSHTNNTLKSVQNDQNFTATCSNKSQTIKAENDQFGAQPGTQQILNVLRNDQQTSCSVLRIESISPLPGNVGTVQPIYSGRFLQLSLNKDASGTQSFTYVITDGHGNKSQATVTININASADAPVQSETPPDYSVEAGASVKVNALDTFTDPDGSPMMLMSAASDNPGKTSATTRSDGQLIFSTGSLTEGRVAVTVNVSNQYGKTGKGTIYFTIRPANSLKPIIDAVSRSVQPGTATTVDLSDYVHGNSVSPVQLTGAKSLDGAADVTFNADDMSVTFKSDTNGTHYVQYTVKQGPQEALGLIRFTVEPLDSKDVKPVAANDVVMLNSEDTAISEPLDNDIDPLGGVLAVTSVKAPAGIRTGIVNNSRVYITADRVPTSPVAIEYTVANAQTTSTGSIIIEPPSLANASCVPKATNVVATVVTGGIVTVPVMQDDVTACDGTTITLDPTLRFTPGFKGLAFVSGDNIRYQANAPASGYSLTYNATDSRRNTAAANVTINVHDKSKDKPAPTPKSVTAAVAAGRTIKIPITLTGIDADGDDVSLMGLGNETPTLGRITKVGADYLLYQAYSDSEGTDTFQYAVEDWKGNRAQAQVKVGVFRSSSSSGVYARDDSITMRPGRKAQVPVTLNDISENDSELTLAKKLISNGGIADATTHDGDIDFTTPAKEGTYYITYSVHNTAGMSATATLSVNVSKNAPISAPTATDYLVAPAQTIDKKSVDVDLKTYISNPSGTADELKVEIDPSAKAHARMKSATVTSVDLTDQPRAVPYTVTNTSYPNMHLSATAFIEVPAYGMFPPVLRPNIKDVTVNAGESVQIKLADYVRVGAGKQAYVNDGKTVTATKGTGTLKDAQTLEFSADKNANGPASISFYVQDSNHPDDKTEGAELQIPIRIIGTTAEPPIFNSQNVTVAAGESQTINLDDLTQAPYGSEAEKKNYSYALEGGAGQFDASISGHSLKISAPDSIRPQTQSTLRLRITYDKGKSVQGTITATATASTQPLARVPDQNVTLKAGETQSINVLSGAYNPFPGTPLTLNDAQEQGGDIKVDVSHSSDGTVRISAPQNAGKGTATVLFTVRDKTGQADREVTAKITISIIGKPDPPQLSPTTTSHDGSVTLNWSAGDANGSPITEYEAQVVNDSAHSCHTTGTSCTIEGLINDTTYDFQVRAKNEVGWSDYSSPVVEGTPYTTPEAPENVTITAGKNSLALNWDAPKHTGAKSGFIRYHCTISGPTPEKQTVGDTSCIFDSPHGYKLAPGTYTATVQAENAVGFGGTASATRGNGSVYGDPSITVDEAKQTNGDGNYSIKVIVNAAGQNLTKPLTCTLNNCVQSSVNGPIYTLTGSIGDRWIKGTQESFTVTAVFDKSGSISTPQKPITFDGYKVPDATVTVRLIQYGNGGKYTYSFTKPDLSKKPTSVHLTTQLKVTGLPNKDTSKKVSIDTTDVPTNLTCAPGKCVIKDDSAYSITVSDDAYGLSKTWPVHFQNNCPDDVCNPPEPDASGSSNAPGPAPGTSNSSSNRRATPSAFIWNSPGWPNQPPVIFRIATIRMLQ